MGLGRHAWEDRARQGVAVEMEYSMQEKGAKPMPTAPVVRQCVMSLADVFVSQATHVVPVMNAQRSLIHGASVLILFPERARPVALHVWI